MRNMKKTTSGILSFLVLVVFCVTAVSGKAGWTNEVWEGLNWQYKACNSETSVFDSPSYAWMNATASIGTETITQQSNDPAPNSSIHVVANGSYTATCEGWGNVGQ